MHTRLRQAVTVGLIAATIPLGMAPAAWSDDKRDDRRERIEQRNRERRDDKEDRDRERREDKARRDYERRREVEHRQWQRVNDRHEMERRREAERRHDEWLRHANRREWERRRELERHRAAAQWRFEHARGWRFEHRPGVWSPFFVWWRVDNRPILRPYPATRIVRYPTGYYELVGDGITSPFYWLWRPTVVVAAPPPIPVPPPMPSDYPFPADGLYLPPPPTG